MPINLGKTKSMLICKDPKDSQFEISIDINNSNGVREIIKIEQTHVKKLLGIMLDEKLSFSDHMTYVQKIAMSNLNKIHKNIYYICNFIGMKIVTNGI